MQNIYFLSEHKIMYLSKVSKNQVVMARWLARRFATREVPGSNPGKGDNLLISD